MLPYILPKDPCISLKCTTSESIHSQKSPAFSEKSPTFSHKSPTSSWGASSYAFYKRTLYSSKRAPHSPTRMAHPRTHTMRLGIHTHSIKVPKSTVSVLLCAQWFYQAAQIWCTGLYLCIYAYIWYIIYKTKSDTFNHCAHSSSTQSLTIKTNKKSPTFRQKSPTFSQKSPTSP